MNHSIYESIGTVLQVILAATPIWLPLILKWRDNAIAKGNQKQAMLADLGVMVFNQVRRAKKFMTPEQRKVWDANEEAIKTAHDLYFEHVGEKPSASEVLRIIGVAEMIHAKKKLEEQPTPVPSV